MMIVSSHTTLALAEGFGLAFSPCILPILPFILAASAVGNKWRPFLIISGFIASFTTFALVSRKILAISGLQQDTIQFGAYILLLVFGLTMIVPYFEKHFAHITNKLASNAQEFSSGSRAEGVWGALLVGALIGVVWTPCAGPLLAAALLQVIQADTNRDAITTVGAFSIGASIPMLAIALLGQQLSHRIRRLAQHATIIRRVMGIVIVAFALTSLFGFNVGVWAAQQGSTTVATPETSPPLEKTSATTTSEPAPDIAGIKQWFNSDPLTIAQLKGKVVLVDFWTYSCINCIRTLPYLETWYEKYKDQGLVVIGVHSPEFPFEGEPDNVVQAIKKFGITYPVAMDNDFKTWKNYHNQYWPAHYLINRDGQIVEVHFGEGGYSQTENAIRSLLGLDAIAVAPDAVVSADTQTHETYLGYQRGKNFASPEMVTVDHATTYHFPDELDLHQWALNGSWTIEGQRITAQHKDAGLRLHFMAGKVFLVLGSETGKPIKVLLTLNGQPLGSSAAGKDAPNGIVTVDQQRLYELVHQDRFKEGVLDIVAQDPGLEAYAFTFGK